MAMNLSPDQKRDFVKARQALIARNEDIKEKRRRIVGDLEVLLVPPELAHASPTRLATASRTSREITSFIASPAYDCNLAGMRSHVRS